MNNSIISLDTFSTPEPDITPQLRAEEARLVRIIEALQGVRETKEWSTLKTEVFDTLVNILERDLKNEARKDDPSPTKLTRLNGELKWAEKYSDLSKLENSYRVDLQRIRQKLHGKTE